MDRNKINTENEANADFNKSKNTAFNFFLKSLTAEQKITIIPYQVFCPNLIVLLSIIITIFTLKISHAIQYNAIMAIGLLHYTRGITGLVILGGVLGCS